MPNPTKDVGIEHIQLLRCITDLDDQGTDPRNQKRDTPLSIGWNVPHLWLRCNPRRSPLVNGVVNGICQIHTITMEENLEKSLAWGKIISTFGI